MSIYPAVTYRDVRAAITWLEAAFGPQGQILDDGAAADHAMLCYGDGMVVVESQRPEDLHGSHTGQGVDLPGRRRRRQALPPGLGRRCREAELVTARRGSRLGTSPSVSVSGGRSTRRWIKGLILLGFATSTQPNRKDPCGEEDNA